jgi:two-component system chemotaxis sensor kinase CheA
MTADSNKLFRMLLDSFREEARERLAEMNRLMVRLETALEEEAAPSLARTEDLHTLYREFHSLKGAARTVELFDIQDLCQAAESLLSAMRQQESRLTQAATSLLLETLDCLETHLDFDGETPGEGATLPSIEPFVARLTQLASQDPTAGAPVTSRPSEEESKPEPELPSEGVEKGSGPAGELAVSLDTVRIGGTASKTSTESPRNWSTREPPTSTSTKKFSASPNGCASAVANRTIEGEP